MKTAVRIVFGVIVAAALAGCNRFSPGPTDTGSVPPPPLPPPPTPVGDEDSTQFLGVADLSPVVDGFAIRWEPPTGPGVDPLRVRYEIFVSLTGAPIDFSSPTTTTDLGVTESEVLGQSVGTPVEIAVRAVNEDDPTYVDANEISLGGVVAALLYVDAAVQVSGDGKSPGQAFKTINEAVIAGIGSGAPVNVLVAGGLYEEEIASLGDVHLFGAYPSGFAGPRDRTQHSSTVRPNPGSSVCLRILANEGLTVVDGIEFLGRGEVNNGVEVREAEIRVSNSSISGMLAEGLTNTADQKTRRFDLHRVQVLDCGTEGVEANGSFEASLSVSVFSGNGNEGVEFDNLAPQPLETAWLRVWGCQFLSNGEDGIDVDFDELDPALGGTSEDGTALLIIEGCAALDNGAWGFLVDVDFDQDDEIDARAFLRGNRASRQVRDGIRLDGDQPAFFVAVDNRTSANRESGVFLSSDLFPAAYYLSNHWDLGSGTQGVTMIGPADVIASHLAVTGSRFETILGNGSAFLNSGALWMGQAASGVQVRYSYSDASLTGTGNIGGEVELFRAPSFLFFVSGPGGLGHLMAPSGVSLSVGDVLEVDDDGVARTVDSIQGNRVNFTPVRSNPVLATSVIGLFADGNVEEDSRLIAGGAWIDAGDPAELDTDATRTDIGVRGGVLSDFRPRRSEGWMPFLPERFDPSFGARSDPVSSVQIRFVQEVDGTSVDTSTFRVLHDGSQATGHFETSGRTVAYVLDTTVSSGTLTVELSNIGSVSGQVQPLPIRFEVVLP